MRHGAGPFPTESESMCHPDTTNIENNWQGELRQGHLDCDLLQEHIAKDVKQVDVKHSVSLAITCMDQVGDEIKVFEKGEYRSCPASVLPKRLLRMIRGKNLYLGWKK